ncbi:MAG: carboxymuconolactone decarboxylase family protein [Chloroflexi bacterium]|nr:carboxymuconolactone decarboxylase family protein [Chloroflexota bacterium]
MNLDNRIQALIAVGASITANCQQCLQATVNMALESGAKPQEIAEAVEIGRRVRKGAGAKMDKFALRQNYTALSTASETDGECGCGS